MNSAFDRSRSWRVLFVLGLMFYLVPVASQAQEASIIAEFGSNDGDTRRRGEDLAIGDLAHPLDITLSAGLGDAAADHHHRRVQQVDDAANRQARVPRTAARTADRDRIVLGDRLGQVATGQCAQVAVQDVG